MSVLNIVISEVQSPKTVLSSDVASQSVNECYIMAPDMDGIWQGVQLLQNMLVTLRMPFTGYSFIWQGIAADQSYEALISNQLIGYTSFSSMCDRSQLPTPIPSVTMQQCLQPPANTQTYQYGKLHHMYSQETNKPITIVMNPEDCASSLCNVVEVAKKFIEHRNTYGSVPNWQFSTAADKKKFRNFVASALGCQINKAEATLVSKEINRLLQQ